MRTSTHYRWISTAGYWSAPKYRTRVRMQTVGWLDGTARHGICSQLAFPVGTTIPSSSMTSPAMLMASMQAQTGELACGTGPMSVTHNLSSHSRTAGHQEETAVEEGAKETACLPGSSSQWTQLDQTSSMLEPMRVLRSSTHQTVPSWRFGPQVTRPRGRVPSSSETYSISGSRI